MCIYIYIYIYTYIHIHTCAHIYVCTYLPHEDLQFFIKACEDRRSWRQTKQQKQHTQKMTTQHRTNKHIKGNKSCEDRTATRQAASAARATEATPRRLLSYTTRATPELDRGLRPNDATRATEATPRMEPSPRHANPGTWSAPGPGPRGPPGRHSVHFITHQSFLPPSPPTFHLPACIGAARSPGVGGPALGFV